MRRLTDAAQRACWSRMAEGPFAKADLCALALAAGQPSVGSYAAVTKFINEQKAKGAVYYSGPPNGGRWILLPKEQWTGTPIPSIPPKPELKAPVDAGPYDPAPDIEGRNNGLTTAFAEHLWHDLSGDDCGMALSSLPIMEQRAWREASDRALAFLFGLGLVGPAGPPREKHLGWSYKWLYEASTWEIVDEDGGCVAMVGNDADVPLFLAAPDMAAAISEVLARVNARGAVKRSDLDELAKSLPKA